ncbi:Nuclear Hormone Receptor family [Caenorhabditis elegans]|uniref:Nuclear Hormone Receptor family n=2 Tax=Caenorhabditis elegans TaxID=6239 RepID=O16390_CAEEL|nr:Nuclear Hormone Receptor family [Caenorhabditis elegans]CCD64872.2 Nuclear Hormone Receptor family [Caenorhabditis elegans]|eukprot:NP_504069.2 Nuclear Hormone Receptor family [Caenorhabditis elegans]
MSSSPPSLSEYSFIDPRKCLVCYRPAYCNNYGVLTCDACKMFFRRVVTEKLEYTCKCSNNCFEGFSEDSTIYPKCKSCRYQECLKFGMNYAFRKQKRLLEIRNKKDDELDAIIDGLRYLDNHRRETLRTKFTISNPTLQEMVEKKGLETYVKTPKEQLRPQDWSFFALYTTVEFLSNMPFMSKLQTAEKMCLLRNSASKCSLFAGAMRSFNEKKAEMITVDGQDIYPNSILDFVGSSGGAREFLGRIKSMVVGKLAELTVLREEFLLISSIIFCNPDVFYEPENSAAQSKVASQQQEFTAALLHFCMCKYGLNGPSRFTQLLSLCPIIQRNFDDLQFLTMMFRMKRADIKFRNIVEELI